MKHFITYKVLGFKGSEFEDNEKEDSLIKRGPYNPEDINSHVNDLKGYAEVYDVKVITE